MGIRDSGYSPKEKGDCKSVWTKFGLESIQATPICIRLRYQKQVEILWVRPLDPAKGEIINIPHPDSDRRYRDLVLFDREVIGHNVVNRRRLPIFDELAIFKRSGYLTFSCSLQTQEEQYIQSLEKLCLEHGLGFEIWSNSTRQMVSDAQQANPEYFSHDLFPASEAKDCVAAFAAYELVDVPNGFGKLAICEPADVFGFTSIWMIELSKFRKLGKSLSP